MTAPARLYARDDPQAQRVAALVEAGWGQPAASRVVFDAPTIDDPWPVWQQWIRYTIDDITADLRRYVGLP